MGFSLEGLAFFGFHPVVETPALKFSDSNSVFRFYP